MDSVPSPIELPTKQFPLRLCEVLEEEFITTHGPLPEPSSWLLRDCDVNFAVLGDWLQGALTSASSTPLMVIRRRIQKDGLVIPPTIPWPAATSQKLLDQLNNALKGDEVLYDHNLLDPDTEAWQLAELWVKRSKAHSATPVGPGTKARGASLEGDARPDVPTVNLELVELNRLLLDAAFPADAIARVDTSRLTRLFDAIGKLEGPDGTYSAVCLSGGGIRSASFALGVLQSLARAGLLAKFDFLSTVSGGGYVGSWLSTWIHRHPEGLTGVVKELGTRARKEAGTLITKIDPAPPPVGFLRSYSHFLNPQAGLFTVDTWTWVGIYLRNLSLNWLVIIPLLLLVVALPRLYSAGLYEWWLAHGELFPLLVWLASLSAVFTLVCVTLNRPSTSDPARPIREPAATPIRRRLDRFLEQFKHQPWLLGFGVLPVFIFAVVLTLLVWGLPSSKAPLSLAQIWTVLRTVALPYVPTWLAFAGYDHLVLWGEVIIVAAWIIAHAVLPARDWGQRFKELVFMLLAGLLTWSIVAKLADFAFATGRSQATSTVLGDYSVHPAHLYAVFAVPTVVLAVLAGMTLFIGLVSKLRWIEDEDREWWGRFGSWILIGNVVWSLLSAITIFGPPLLLQFPKLLAALGGVSGLLAVLLGKSSLTSATAPKDSAKPDGVRATKPFFGVNMLATAGAIFLAVFLAFLSLLTSALLIPLLAWLGETPIEGEGFIPSTARMLLGPLRPLKDACGHVDASPTWLNASVFDDPNAHLELICQAPLNIIAVAVAALALFAGLASLAINLNKFSLHAAYRIRIVRTFLGASRGNNRQPNPFTGFDPLDDLQMHELRPGLVREADIASLSKFIGKLREALPGKATTPAGYLVHQMTSRQHDPDGVLKGRLSAYSKGHPVLKSLEQDVLEVLNRIMEIARLDKVAAFQGLPVGEKDAAELKKYVDHGNLIFANRLLLQVAFPNDIKRYAFPPPPPHKLIHIVNLTLNLVHGRRLAWQERKAAPFVVTPMHAGSYYLGYRKSRDYGGKDGISVGTAVAVSGAAVSPNMGYSSSPLTALLLTLFNVRLGWWLGNPGVAGTDTYARSEPRFSLRPLLSEALGLTDDLSPYAYLSDGGHFENMGLFEMVLRRCQLIVCTDSGADPDYQFADIGNAVRKIRIDLGIPIEFDSVPVHRQRSADDDSGRYCYFGRIRYSYVDGDEAPDGIVICFKPVLRGKEPQDVLNYAARNKAFPQEPTSDQFFGESQFESYRQLGEFAVETVFGTEPPPASTSWAYWAALRASNHVDGPTEPKPWLKAWLQRMQSIGIAADRRTEAIEADG
jgi:hypothetical protein